MFREIRLKRFTAAFYGKLSRIEINELAPIFRLRERGLARRRILLSYRESLRTYLEIIRTCTADSFEIGSNLGCDSLIERGLFF